MKTLMTKAFCLSVPLFLNLSCGQERAQDSDLDLVGGQPATDQQIPAVVKIKSPSCTATKIAPKRFLTAGHCVYNNRVGVKALYPQYRAGSKIQITGANLPTDGSFTTLTIRKTVLHNTYWSRAHGSTDSPYINANASDIAYFEVQENTPGIPAMAVWREPIPVGTSVFISGYGCENGVKWPTYYGKYGRLKWKIVKTLSKADLDHPNKSFNFDVNGVYARSLITNGAKRPGGGASLCPGDSGGPLMIWGHVVGVNSYYSFDRFDPSQTSYTNWHAKISHPEVRYWLP